MLPIHTNVFPLTLTTGKRWENIVPAMRKTALRESLVLALALSTVLGGASQSAHAAEATISVLGLEPAAGAPDAVATAVTEAVRQRVSSTTGFRLMPGRDLVEVKLVFSCPDEAPACMTQAAQSIGAAKLIFGNLQPVGTDAYLVTLKLLDAEKGVVEGWSSEQITKAQATPVALRGPAQKWLAALTGQSMPGGIKVTGGVVGANVWLDGTPAGILGTGGLTLTGVADGSHEIVVSKAGYEKFERKVSVAAGATETVAVELKAIAQPGQGEPTAAEGSSEAKPELTETPSGLPRNQGSRVAAWLLLGAGLVGLGVGGYSSYQIGVVNSNLDPYRRYPCASGGAPTCSADGKTDLHPLTTEQQSYVSQQQETGDTYTTVQWVGYGLGGALLATSVVFFYRGYFAQPDPSSSDDHRSNMIVMPSFGPGTAGAVAYLSF
jgi:hypothetical protein